MTHANNKRKRNRGRNRANLDTFPFVEKGKSAPPPQKKIRFEILGLFFNKKVFKMSSRLKWF